MFCLVLHVPLETNPICLFFDTTHRYNLLEVANINMFDHALNSRRGTNAQGGLDDFNGHPLRVMLYIHLFSHGLAEELTTEHLVQENAVFSQVFSLKYEALTTYLTGIYNRFTFASDEDFEERESVNQLLTGNPVLDYASNPRPPLPINCNGNRNTTRFSTPTRAKS